MMWIFRHQLEAKTPKQPKIIALLIRIGFLLLCGIFLEEIRYTLRKGQLLTSLSMPFTNRCFNNNNQP